jgi:hypothetical protein
MQSNMAETGRTADCDILGVAVAVVVGVTIAGVDDVSVDTAVTVAAMLIMLLRW